jgi:hypothetical protein
MTAKPGHITIQELEHAINFWRDREPRGELSLGPIARHLATPYALMIHDRHQSIEVSTLDARQLDAIKIANEKAA